MNSQSRLVLLIRGLLVAGALCCSTNGRVMAKTFPPKKPRCDDDTVSATQEVVKADGIERRVEIHRDSYGVPHIFAESDADAAFGLGYAHAQDRFFQMDQLRRAWQGRQSEIFGPKAVEMDKLFRLLRIRQRIQKAWDRMPAEERVIFERYAAGVNAALQAKPSPIHSLLKLGHGPWTELDSLGISELLNWQVAENFTTELLLAKVASKVGPQKARELRPTYPDDGPFMIERNELPVHLRDEPACFRNSIRRRLRNRKCHVSLLPTKSIQDSADHLLAILDDVQKLPIGAGSNAWAVAPSRSATGEPLLAYDPHLSISAPSPWYHAHLKTSDREAIGFTIPGLPMVVAGHNTFCSFGFTVNNTDTQDLYFEKIHPQNPDTYWSRGTWTEMKTEKETIQVRGQQPVSFVTRWTMHGPVISDLSPGAKQVMSLRWTVLEADPLKTIAGFRGMIRAKSWNEWRTAARLLEDSPKNFVYADRDGNIGCMTTGRLPLRKPGLGDFPAPGWDGQHEWSGYVPPTELPYSFNPPKGFVASANEKSWPKEYKHDRFLNGRWAHPYRQRRIQEWMNEKRRLTVGDMKAMQLDVKSTLAPMFLKMALPALKESKSREILWAASVLERWNYRTERHQIAPALYHALYIKTARNTLVDELGEKLLRQFLDDQYLFQERLRTILATNAHWVDDVNQPGQQTRDELFRQSMKDALEMLSVKIGPNRKDWTWGRIHTVQWTAAPAAMLPNLSPRFVFPPEPVAVDGGPDTLLRAKYKMDSPFKVSQYIASSRLIVDWSRPKSAWAINSTGQSEGCNRQPADT